MTLSFLTVEIIKDPNLGRENQKKSQNTYLKITLGELMTFMTLSTFYDFSFWMDYGSLFVSQCFDAHYGFGKSLD